MGEADVDRTVLNVGLKLLADDIEATQEVLDHMRMIHRLVADARTHLELNGTIDGWKPPLRAV